MGNYCCVQEVKELPACKILKKVSTSSNSTTASKLNSVDSMKKHSHKLLQFLKTDHSNSSAVASEKIEDIEVVSQLGKGGQSKVFQIVIKKTTMDQQLADSEEEKIAVKRTNLKKQKFNMEALELSKKLLHENDSPFLINALFTFVCQKYLYSGMQVAEGGDLTSFLEKWRGKGDAFRSLEETGIRFVMAGIVLGLEYLHTRGLIYCDLKTDNVLIDSKGYPLLSDFQLVSDKDKILVEDLQGTITSMGPEVHFLKCVDKAIDLWALGILLYFITYNTIPYSAAQIECPSFVSNCKSKEGYYVLARKPVSKPLSNLINSLLRVKPHERLGYNSMEEIKNHEFFVHFDWAGYSNRQLESPLEEIVRRFPIKSKLRKAGSGNNKSVEKLRKLRKYTA